MTATVLLILGLVAPPSHEPPRHHQLAVQHHRREIPVIWNRREAMWKRRAERRSAQAAAAQARVVRSRAASYQAAPPTTAPAVSSSPSSSGVTGAICAAFGSYCSQAIAVARCESGLTTTAVNGQYLGLFQMGSAERAQYGDSSTAAGQAAAAAAYFFASGAAWSPWSCKP